MKHISSTGLAPPIAGPRVSSPSPMGTGGQTQSPRKRRRNQEGRETKYNNVVIAAAKIFSNQNGTKQRQRRNGAPRLHQRRRQYRRGSRSPHPAPRTVSVSRRARRPLPNHSVARYQGTGTNPTHRFHRLLATGLTDVSCSGALHQDRACAAPVRIVLSRPL